MKISEYIGLSLIAIVLGMSVLMFFNSERDAFMGPCKFTIPGGTFDMDVRVIITKDTAYAAQYIRENLDASITGNDLDCRGATFGILEGRGPIIWLPSAEDVSINNHELFHATMNIMQWAGVEYSDKTEETYAYQMQYLSNQFYNKIK
jgi:hypothetical protein